MEDEYLYVVTNPENGWDCVVGVFTTRKKAIKHILGEDVTKEDIDNFNENESIYVIHTELLDK